MGLRRSSADAAAKPSDGAELDGGAPSLSKAAKKKQKKAKSANGPENGAGAESAADGAVEEPGAASAAEAAEMILRVDDIIKCAPRQREQ